MSLAQFNYVESLLWFGFALMMVEAAHRMGKQPLRPVALITAATFLLFGISDVIEAQTGAWWHPVELLILKVACVLILAGCFVWYRQLLKSRQKNR